jgi:hypothetical protein
MRARWLAIAAVCLASVCAVSGQAADPAPAVTTPAEQGHFYNLDTERQVEGTIQEVLFEPRYEDRAPFLVIVLKEKNTGRVFRVEGSPSRSPAPFTPGMIRATSSPASSRPAARPSCSGTAGASRAGGEAR